MTLHVRPSICPSHHLCFSVSLPAYLVYYLSHAASKTSSCDFFNNFLILHMVWLQYSPRLSNSSDSIAALNINPWGLVGWGTKSKSWWGTRSVRRLENRLLITFSWGRKQLVAVFLDEAPLASGRSINTLHFPGNSLRLPLNLARQTVEAAVSSPHSVSGLGSSVDTWKSTWLPQRVLRLLSLLFGTFAVRQVQPPLATSKNTVCLIVMASMATVYVSVFNRLSQ